VQFNDSSFFRLFNLGLIHTILLFAKLKISKNSNLYIFSFKELNKLLSIRKIYNFVITEISLGRSHNLLLDKSSSLN